MNYLELLNRFYDLLQCSQVSNNAQLLYYTLLQIDNKCSWLDWFSRTNVSLCGMMGVSENAMKRARAELKQMGLIDFKPSKRRGESTQYHICTVRKDIQIDTKADTQPDTKEKDRPDNLSFCTVQMDTQSDTKTDTQSDTQMDTETDTIIKPKQKQKHRQKSISNDIPEKCAQNPELDKAIKAFIAYRQKRKKPMTDRAVMMLLDKLEALAPGDDAKKIAILDQSVFNSWTGVFALKQSQEDKAVQGKGTASAQGAPNRFHNFTPSVTNYDELMQQRVKQRMEGGCR